MKKMMILAFTLALGASTAGATAISGNIAIAGADTYTGSGIHFNSPAVVLIGTGNFLPFVGTTFPIVGPSHQLNFGAAGGITLFSASGISMDLLTLNVISQSNMFLNIVGTANMVEAGFDTTLYDYTLTATRPDGVSSYTLTAAPPAPVAEIGTLILVGTALVIFALGGFAHRRSQSKALKGYPLSGKLGAEV